MKTYKSAEDIDFYVGMLMENSKFDHNVVGKTVGCIIADQFVRLKQGDRFFYEMGKETNPYAFTPSKPNNMYLAILSHGYSQSSEKFLH